MLFLQPGWCQFSATAFDQEESLTDHGSPPPPGPSSCYSGDYHLLSVTCPDNSEETHQRQQEQATLLVRVGASRGSQDDPVGSN